MGIIELNNNTYLKNIIIQFYSLSSATITTIKAAIHITIHNTFERKFNSLSKIPILDLGSREFIDERHYLPVYITIPITLPVATYVFAHSVLLNYIPSFYCSDGDISFNYSTPLKS